MRTSCGIPNERSKVSSFEQSYIYTAYKNVASRTKPNTTVGVLLPKKLSMRVKHVQFLMDDSKVQVKFYRSRVCSVISKHMYWTTDGLHIDLQNRPPTIRPLVKKLCNAVLFGCFCFFFCYVFNSILIHSTTVPMSSWMYKNQSFKLPCLSVCLSNSNHLQCCCCCCRCFNLQVTCI